jgi:hypothetical protein
MEVIVSYVFTGFKDSAEYKQNPILTDKQNKKIKFLAEFYILLTVHLDVILVNAQLDALFLNVFISCLCMF